MKYLIIALTLTLIGLSTLQPVTATGELPQPTITLRPTATNVGIPPISPISPIPKPPTTTKYYLPLIFNF